MKISYDRNISPKNEKQNYFKISNPEKNKNKVPCKKHNTNLFQDKYYSNTEKKNVSTLKFQT